MFFDKLDDFLVHILRLGAHRIEEVGAVEGAFELRGILNAETSLDVRAHFVGRRGRKGNDRGDTYLVDGMANLAVFGPEIVAPFRYTVSFINGIESYMDSLEEPYVLFFVQRLRCNIEQLGVSLDNISLYAVYLRLLQRRVEIVRHAILLTKAVDDIHLVLHQGDKRGDNNGGSVHHQRRKLIAKALSAARGHEDKAVVASQKIADDRLLVALELVEAKEMLERFGQIYFLCHC